LLRRIIWWKFIDVLEVLSAIIIALMMEAASTSETSENFYQIIRRNKPEDSHLQHIFSLHKTLLLGNYPYYTKCIL
jgi:hypothetical protein